MPGPIPYLGHAGSRPGPFCEIIVSWHGRTERIRALLDSGADGTIVPMPTIATLALDRIGDARVKGVQGPRQLRGVYRADIDFLGFPFIAHPVVGVPDRDYALVGRDILNRYLTTLDGPNLQFSVV